MNFKNKIEKNFDIASSSYSRVDEVQKKSAKYLVEMFIRYNKNFVPHSIFDIGCGTGNVLCELYNYFPKAKYIINDISLRMLGFVAAKYACIYAAHHKDIEELLINDYYGLIISNLCLQWTANWVAVVKKICNKAEVIAFTLLLDGSLQEWRELFGLQYKKYPSLDIIKKNICDFCEYKIETNAFKVSFNSPFDAAKYLKNLGANFFGENLDMCKIYNILRNNKNTCILNYNVAFIVAKSKNLLNKK